MKNLNDMTKAELIALAQGVIEKENAKKAKAAERRANLSPEQRAEQRLKRAEYRETRVLSPEQEEKMKARRKAYNVKRAVRIKAILAAAKAAGITG